MTCGFHSFLALPKQERRTIFEAAADQFGIFPLHVEKDFWVCLVLDALFHRNVPIAINC